MADNKYSFAKDNMSYGKNDNLPTNLQPEKVVSDSIMNSVGLYSKEDVKAAKFSKFSRFGRVLDPYGRVNPGREFLFFVKPDLHICVENKLVDTGSNSVYSISGAETSNPYTRNDLTLNPQLTGNMYFKDLIDTHPDVIPELQFGVTSTNDPFSHLLSFSVNSNLPLDSSTAKTMDNPSTMFGTNYNYLQDSEASDEAYSFSLEFVDDKELNTYHFFRAYSEYHIARKSGLVTPPNMDYYRYKRLHNTMGIYKFIVAEDMETILYWAYLCGVIPTSCPREAFQDPSFTEGLTFSVNFEAAFIEDMNPIILHTFNKMMMLRHNGIDKNNWIPIVRQNMQKDMLYGTTHSYDESIIPNDLAKSDALKNYSLTASDRIDGTLPSFALVDGRQIGNERLKYRLRWYA